MNRSFDQWPAWCGLLTAHPINAAMGLKEVQRFCELDARDRRLLDAAYERLGVYYILGQLAGRLTHS